jgi:hypothetical protein
MNLSIPSIKPLGFALVITAVAQIVNAAPFVFSEDGLLLGIRASGGTGTGQNVFYNLGSTITIKNTPNQGVIGNIAVDLAATYGANWFSRTDLHFGVFGNRSNLSPALEPGSPPLIEPGSTVYLSTATTAAGAASLRPQLGTSSLSSGSTRYAGIKGFLLGTDTSNTEAFTATASGATILDQILQPVSWNNSWTVWNPVPGAAFVVFTGGIQNTFGPGSEALVDVQRMVPSTPTTYVTTVGISDNGDIRLFTSSPASVYNTWIATFPSITIPADKLAEADPDKDEIENLMEFVLNGNPSVSGQSILPTLDSSGANFVFNFTRRADSAGEVAQVFEYSVDLADWTTNPPVAIPVAPGTSGFATVGASTGTAPNQVQAVTVTIPKGANTKLFGRLRAVK